MPELPSFVRQCGERAIYVETGLFTIHVGDAGDARVSDAVKELRDELFEMVEELDRWLAEESGGSP